ncbi:MAG: phosphodiester glycosidase family protein [Ruminococcaceae bacterium]|nr:phosphodiester glycosidase family protein [Oscillospiraceae bacterium]
MNTNIKQKQKRRSPRRRKDKLTVGKVFFRIGVAFLALLISLITALYILLYTVAYGPSESVRNLLVLSALQASATKWVPGLVLPEQTVQEIWDNSFVVNTEEIDIEQYVPPVDENGAVIDEWADYPEGIRYETVNGSTFKAYILLVKDPSRVFVGPTYDYESAAYGVRIFDACEKEGVVAAINAGEYLDTGGGGNGARPMGLTYSKGTCVWNDGYRKTFMGFDKNDRLIVREPLTKAEADELGIRDGVSFQTGNILIEKTADSVKLHYEDGNNGTAQRTAIGQREDGTVILLVTDGRTASSLGATHNDVIDIMVDYGAVSAGMLDGGSSSMMYYKDYYTKYNIDESTLDQYQKQGMINKYKAFTTPRRIPTYFMVRGE